MARDEYVFTKGLDGVYSPALNLNVHKEEVRNTIPSSMLADWGALESYAESKRYKEHLKICAFYNKLFPSLEAFASYNGASYNVPPFTLTDQEMPEVGIGISKNYLKIAIDTVVAKLQNITFDVRVQSGAPIILLEMYKTQIERYFKSQIKSNRLEHVATEVFHDASILGYSHVFIDPWSRKIRKVNDWEFGIYEPEFEKYDIKRCYIRDKAFPVSSLAPYVEGMDPKTVKNIVSARDHVDLELYMDCFQQKKVCHIDGYTSPATPYPFENVLISTFQWDTGPKRCFSTSLFDLLFPLQRQINKFCAKLDTMYLNYKGTVPVITTMGDVDAMMRQLTNKSGEVLVLSGAVSDVTKMIGQIDPVPLNPTFGAEIEALKGNMLELAGVQEVSMNLDNLRSAAAVVALDQFRDARFEPQLFRVAEFISDVLINLVRFNAGMSAIGVDIVGEIPWKEMIELVDSTYLEIIPVHGTDPEDKPIETPEDFQLYAVDQFIIDVINGNKTIEDVDYSINKILLKKQAVNKLLRFKALKGDYGKLEEFVLMLFIADVRSGAVKLESPAEPVAPKEESAAGADGQAPQTPAEGGAK